MKVLGDLALPSEAGAALKACLIISYLHLCLDPGGDFLLGGTRVFFHDTHNFLEWAVGKSLQSRLPGGLSNCDFPDGWVP